MARANGTASADVESSDDIGVICELRTRYQKFDKNGDLKSGVLKDKEVVRGHGVDQEYAIVNNQIYNKQNQLEKEVLTVNSEQLLAAFRQVVVAHPVVASDFNEPFEMESPFQMLYHAWDDLHRYIEECNDDRTRMHLNLLFEFMESAMGPERRRCLGQLKKQQLDYSRLWTIYRPRDTLISYDHDNPRIFRCVKTAYEANKRMGPYFEVQCTFTDCDGTNIGEGRHTFQIRQKEFFVSEHPGNVRDLPVFPRSFVDDDGLEQRLYERGLQFMGLKGVCIRQYEGQAAYMKRPPSSFYDPDMALFDTVWLPYKETGRVIVDRKKFQEDHELSGVGKFAESKDLDVRFCPPFVYGYSAARKDWSKLYLVSIRETVWKKTMMDDLVMDNEQKTLLKALVTSHSFPTNPGDIMQQKGKGLVVLLHGSPGAGKTLTAETCAEITERALLSTSLAELNKENLTWLFEYELRTLLQYATTWQAVVLMDEADVFLEARKDDVPNAAERNALVAIFLRHLEYFGGIVFLTTNRIQVFDEAMKSRVHLALGYKPPGSETRKMLWLKNLKAATGSEVDPEISDAIDSFTSMKLNGREIANAINTAQTLARYESSTLKLNHIQTVLNVRKTFERDLTDIASKSEKHGFGPLSRRGTMLERAEEEDED
ncbi:hypothetical protein N0V86_001434 [Didymella sp. IMI 355093]|nr:hypothetical protein N0V86_001434 [Didymella sp. IMI 355093]